MFIRSESTIQQRNVVLSELVITNTGKKTVLNTVLHYFVNRNRLTLGVLLCFNTKWESSPSRCN